MNRRAMLKGLGSLGVGSLFSMDRVLKAESLEAVTGKDDTCFLTPFEEEGPFYLDEKLIRRDITQDTSTGAIKSGAPLVMQFEVVNKQCAPVPNVLVDVWHADKDGAYSGFPGQPDGLNTTGQNFLRGIQVTDANGRCSFKTVYPGWYPGRVAHIHFKVRLSSKTYVTSQCAFPDARNKEVYATSLYAGRGQSPLTNATDEIFHDANPKGLVVEVRPNQATGGYDGKLKIGIASTLGLNEGAPGPDSHALHPNSPNPFKASTTIPYHLPKSGHVSLSIHDAHGHELTRLVDEYQPAGTREAVLNAAGLKSGFYFCTMKVGVFTQTRELLCLR